jgi:uncharacterized protein YkwD
MSEITTIILWTVCALIFFAIFVPKRGFSGLLKLKRLTERKRSYQLYLLNIIRKKHGLTALKDFYEIDRVAMGHSYSMSKNKTCNHDGFSGRASKVRQLAGSGYVGENCFMYPSSVYNNHTARRLVEGWVKSPGHRANILNPKYGKIGIGIVTKGHYVFATQIFCS